MGQRILLADDSHTIRKVVELTFADTDYQVVAVQNGDLALQKIRENRPDIILLDVIMPGKDGYDVCDLVKSDPNLSSIPVLLMAGSFEPYDKERALRVGSDGYLPKPFDSRSLVTRVKELLDAARQRTAPIAAAAAEEPPPPPPPTATPEPMAPLHAAAAAPDSTVMFPAYREISAAETVGFEEFTADAGGDEGLIGPPPAPKEASFADLADDMKQWEKRTGGTQPVPVVKTAPPEPPPAPAAIEEDLYQPFGRLAQPVETTPIEEAPAPVEAPAESETPLWRVETPLVLEEVEADEAEAEEVVEAQEAPAAESPLSIWNVEAPVAGEAGAVPMQAPVFKPEFLQTQESIISEIPLEMVPDAPAAAPLLVERLSATESAAPISIEEPATESHATSEESYARGMATLEPVPEAFAPPPYEQTFAMEEDVPSLSLAEPVAEEPAAPEPELEMPVVPPAPQAVAEQLPFVIEDESVEVQKIDLPPATMPPASEDELPLEPLEEEAPPVAAEPAAPPPQAAPWGMEELLGEAKPLVAAPVLAEEAPAEVAVAAEAYVAEQAPSGAESPFPTEEIEAPSEAITAGTQRKSKVETIPDLLKSEPKLLKWDSLPPEAVDAVARRVVEIMSEKILQEIAWEVVPDLAEQLIKKEIERLQKGM